MAKGDYSEQSPSWTWETAGCIIVTKYDPSQVDSTSFRVVKPIHVCLLKCCSTLWSYHWLSLMRNDALYPGWVCCNLATYSTTDFSSRHPIIMSTGSLKFCPVINSDGVHFVVSCTLVGHIGSSLSDSVYQTLPAVLPLCDSIVPHHSI